ncbi:hypothetical protein BCAR13_420062 [Paraburkholderia caribensis]|nr:hypothetical protein BCAR13_420062 [Paraburkholderia caribensis]
MPSSATIALPHLNHAAWIWPGAYRCSKGFIENSVRKQSTDRPSDSRFGGPHVESVKTVIGPQQTHTFRICTDTGAGLVALFPSELPRSVSGDLSTQQARSEG